MNRKTLALFGVSALVAGVLACSSAKPATPVAPTATEAQAAPDGSTLKASAPGVQSPVDGQKLTSDVIVLTISPSRMTFADAPLQYRYQVMTTAGAIVDQAQVPSTSRQIGATLLPNTTYTWRARAEVADASGQIQASSWSPTASFVTRDPALVDDPLTNGTTVGRRNGGHFVAGQGWQSDSLTDSIDYSIPTCSDCRVEFDITNIGRGEGGPFGRDVKWLSMGDANAFGDFNAFRDHGYKMHLEQRADGDGTAMKLIWRNGRAGGGDPGDHTDIEPPNKVGGPNWNSSQVFHFVFDWTPGGFTIEINGERWFSGSFNRPFDPPNHLVELGCTPRAESFIGIIFRNVRITKH